MSCINSIAAEQYAIDQDTADKLEAEWEFKVDQQIHDLIHKERLASAVLHMFENSLLEEPLLKCYLAKTDTEKLKALEDLLFEVEISLIREAHKRASY